MKNKLLFLILAGQLAGIGNTIQALDEDRTGADDIFGRIVMPAAGRVLNLIALGKIAEADAVLDEIIDGLCDYRGRQIPPPALPAGI